MIILWNDIISHDFVYSLKTRLLLIMASLYTRYNFAVLFWQVQAIVIVSSNTYAHHYSDVIMGAIASQITSLTVVYPTVYSNADIRKHQSSASLAFVLGIHINLTMRSVYVTGELRKEISPWTGIHSKCMMTSSNGNIFRFTGHLCGEFTGHRWIPRTKTSFGVFLICAWINCWANNR